MGKITSVGFAAIGALVAMQMSAASAQQNKDFAVSFGVAGVYRPVYMGSDSTEFTARPLIDINWRNTIEIEDYDLKINAFAGRHFKAGLIFSYDEGRQDNSSGNANTKKVHNVDATAMGGVFASYFFDTWKFDFRLQQDVVSGNNTNGGFIAQGSVMYGARITRESTFMIGPRITYGSEDYMQSYYGVTSADATRSGFTRFTPSAGIRDFAIVGKFNYDITPRWIAVVTAEYAALQGDAKDSPMSRQDAYGSVSMGVKYKF